MGGLRKFVDKIKPTFSEGGKLSFLASTFDAFETFLFVPNTTTTYPRERRRYHQTSDGTHLRTL